MTLRTMHPTTTAQASRVSRRGGAAASGGGVASEASHTSNGTRRPCHMRLRRCMPDPFTTQHCTSAAAAAHASAAPGTALAAFMRPAIWCSRPRPSSSGMKPGTLRSTRSRAVHERRPTASSATDTAVLTSPHSIARHCSESNEERSSATTAAPSTSRSDQSATSVTTAIDRGSSLLRSWTTTR